METLKVTASADASARGLSEAYAGGQVASGGRVGLLGSQDYMATPFSVTSYTQELIRDQQAASVGEVLLNDASVRVARGFGNFQQLYQVRGLPIFSDDMSYNGLYGLLPRQYLAADLIERVEVLRGANAFLNGASPGGSGLGGAVNIMPKRAANEVQTVLSAGVQTGGQSYGAIDLGRRFDEGRLGLRLNLAGRDGDTSVDGESLRLKLASLGADYHRGSLRLSADLGYQDHRRLDSQPSITIASGLAIPKAPDASRSVGQAWTFSNERDRFGTLRLEQDLGIGVTLWLAGGFRSSHESARFANPTLYDTVGDMSSYRFDNVREDLIRTGEAGLRAGFRTGQVNHALSASVSGFSSSSKNAYAFSNFAGFTGQLYAPTQVAAPSADYFIGGKLSAPLVTERIGTASQALADQLSLGNWQFTAGLRRQLIQNRSYDYNTGAQYSSYSKSATTPVAGLLYRASRALSLYGNYIEGLSKGDVAPAFSGSTPVVNAGEVLAPYRTRQSELGIKFDTGRLGGSLGVFRSDKPTAGVDSNGRFRPLPSQRSQGLELSAFGLLCPQLKLLGGLSLLDTRSATGKDAIGAPRLQGNLGLDWAVPEFKGLNFDARWIHSGAQFADSTNTQRVPSWNRIDMGLRHTQVLDSRTSLTARLRLENLAGSNYWASAGGYPGAGYLTVGAPRNLVASLSLEF
jgi:iron complex outermembrane receptor protein